MLPYADDDAACFIIMMLMRALPLCCAPLIKITYYADEARVDAPLCLRYYYAMR